MSDLNPQPTDPERPFAGSTPLALKPFSEWSVTDDEDPLELGGQREDAIQQRVRYANYLRESYINAEKYSTDIESEIVVGLHNGLVADGLLEAGDAPTLAEIMDPDETSLDDKIYTVSSSLDLDDKDIQLFRDYNAIQKVVDRLEGTDDLAQATIEKRNALRQQAEEVASARFDEVKDSAVHNNQIPFARIQDSEGRMRFEVSKLAEDMSYEKDADGNVRFKPAGFIEAIKASKVGGVNLAHAHIAMQELEMVEGMNVRRYEGRKLALLHKLMVEQAKKDEGLRLQIEGHAHRLADSERSLDDQKSTGQASVLMFLLESFKQDATDLVGIIGEVGKDKKLYSEELEKRAEIKRRAHVNGNEYVRELRQKFVESGVLTDSEMYSPEEMRKAYFQLVLDTAVNKNLFSYTEDKDKLGSNIRTYGFLGPRIHRAAMARKSTFDATLAARPDLSDELKDRLRLQRDAHLKITFPSTNELLLRDASGQADDWSEALTKGKAEGKEGPEILQEFLDDEDNFKKFSKKVKGEGLGLSKGVIQSVGDAFLYPALFFPAVVAKAKWAQDALSKASQTHADRQEIAYLFGEDIDWGQHLAQTAAPVFVDITTTALLSLAATPAAGVAYAGLKSAASGGARLTASGVLKGLTSSVLRATTEEGVKKAAETAVLRGLIKESVEKGGREGVMKTIRAYNSTVARQIGASTAVFVPAASRASAATYGSLWNVISQQDPSLTREQIHDRVLGPSLATGAVTGLIAGAFTFVGRGGIDDALLNGATYKHASNLIRALGNTGNIPKELADMGIKKYMTQQVANQLRKYKPFALSRNSLAVRAGKGVLHEFSEESLQQFASILIEDAALRQNTPMIESIRQSLFAGSLGAVFGGAVPMIQRGADKFRYLRDKKIASSYEVAQTQKIVEEFDAGVIKQLEDAGLPEAAKAYAETQITRSRVRTRDIDTPPLPVTTGAETVSVATTVDAAPVLSSEGRSKLDSLEQLEGALEQLENKRISDGLPEDDPDYNIEKSELISKWETDNELSLPDNPTEWEATVRDAYSIPAESPEATEAIDYVGEMDLEGRVQKDIPVRTEAGRTRRVDVETTGLDVGLSEVGTGAVSVDEAVEELSVSLNENTSPEAVQRLLARDIDTGAAGDGLVDLSFVLPVEQGDLFAEIDFSSIDHGGKASHLNISQSGLQAKEQARLDQINPKDPEDDPTTLQSFSPRLRGTLEKVAGKREKKTKPRRLISYTTLPFLVTARARRKKLSIPMDAFMAGNELTAAEKVEAKSVDELARDTGYPLRFKNSVSGRFGLPLVDINLKEKADFMAASIYSYYPVIDTSGRGTKWKSDKKSKFFNVHKGKTNPSKNGEFIRGEVDEDGYGIFNNDPVLAASMLSHGLRVKVPEDFDLSDLNPSIQVEDGMVTDILRPVLGDATQDGTRPLMLESTVAQVHKIGDSQINTNYADNLASVYYMFSDPSRITDRIYPETVYPINPTNGEPESKARVSFADFHQQLSDFLTNAVTYLGKDTSIARRMVTVGRGGVPLTDDTAAFSAQSSVTEYMLSARLFDLRDQFIKSKLIDRSPDGYSVSPKPTRRSTAVKKLMKELQGRGLEPKFLEELFAKKALRVISVDPDKELNTQDTIIAFIEQKILNEKDFEGDTMPPFKKFTRRVRDRLVDQEKGRGTYEEQNAILSLPTQDLEERVGAIGAVFEAARGVEAQLEEEAQAELALELDLESFEKQAQNVGGLDPEIPIGAETFYSVITNTVDAAIRAIETPDPVTGDTPLRTALNDLAFKSIYPATPANKNRVERMTARDLMGDIGVWMSTGNHESRPEVLKFIRNLKESRFESATDLKDAFYLTALTYRNEGNLYEDPRVIAEVRRLMERWSPELLSRMDEPFIGSLRSDKREGVTGEPRPNLRSIDDRIKQFLKANDFAIRTRYSRAYVNDTLRPVMQEQNLRDVARLGLVSEDPQSVIGALEKISKTSETPSHRLVADLLLEDTSFISRVEFVMDEADLESAGRYNKLQDGSHLVYVNLASGNGRGLENVLLEEYTHAFLSDTLNKPTNQLTPNQRAAKARLQGLYTHARDSYRTKGKLNPVLEDGLENFDEFVAHFLLSPEFQKYVVDLPAQGKQNILTRLYEVFASLFRKVTGKESKKYADALRDIIDLGRSTYRSNETDIKALAASVSDFSFRSVRRTVLRSAFREDRLGAKALTEIEQEAALRAKRSNRPAELAVAAVRLRNGEITAEQYASLVDRYDPYRVKGAPTRIPSISRIKEYLRGKAKNPNNPSETIDKSELAGRPLEEGTEVEVRIDIPAYNRSVKEAADRGDTDFEKFAVYALTLHAPVPDAATRVGSVLSFAGAVKINNPRMVTRSISGKGGAIMIAAGQGKIPLATVKGEYEAVSELPADLSDPNQWTEASYNPLRSSFFVDVRTKQAVVGGSEAIMVGSRVFVKEAQLRDRPRGVVGSPTEDVKNVLYSKNRPDEQSAKEAIEEVLGEDTEIEFEDDTDADTFRMLFDHLKGLVPFGMDLRVGGAGGVEVGVMSVSSDEDALYVNSRALMDTVADMDDASARGYAAFVLDEEVGHTSGFNALDQSDVQAVIDDTTDEEFARIADEYYRGSEEAEIFKRRLRGEDVEESLMLDRSLEQEKQAMIEEHLRMLLQKVTRGFTTEQAYEFYSQNPSRLALLKQYFRNVMSKYASASVKTRGSATDAALNKMIIEYRAIQGGFVRKTGAHKARPLPRLRFNPNEPMEGITAYLDLTTRDYSGDILKSDIRRAHADKTSDRFPTSAHNTLYSDEGLPDKSEGIRKNEDAADYFKRMALEFWGDKLDSSNITPEQQEIITQLAVEEFEAAFHASGKNASDWYSTAIEVALAVASVIHPELADADIASQIPAFEKAENPAAAADLTMRLALAITSQNLSVSLNTRFADEQYTYFRENGRFDPSQEYGEKAESISSNLRLANEAIDRLGFEGLENFIRQDFKVSDLEKAASKIIGRKVSVTGTKNEIVQGAAMFGPKIGQGFLQNIMGNFYPVTIDLWLRRTWGRWTGNVVDKGVTEERLATLLDAARDYGIPLVADNPEAGVTTGVYINDSTQPFTDQILNGVKTVETRDNTKLDAVVGKRVGIVRTGKKKSVVVGYATIGDRVDYDSVESFRADQDRHLVEKGSKFDIKDKKYGYPLLDVKLEPNPYSVTPDSKMGRFTFAKIRPPELGSDLKKIRAVTRKNKSGTTYRTVSDAVVKRLESDDAFREEIVKVAKDLNRVAESHYKMTRMPMTPEVADLVRNVESYDHKKFIRSQEKAIRNIEAAFAKARPKLNEQRKELQADFSAGRITESEFKTSKRALSKAGFTEQWHRDNGRVVTLTKAEINALRPAWARASKVLADSLKPIDVPSNQDRRVISEVINEARKRLEKKGYTVTNADVQAVLWYPEKDIWERVKGNEESSLKSSYDDEFIELARQRGVGEQANRIATRIRDDRSRRSSRNRAVDDAGAGRSVRGGSVQLGSPVRRTGRITGARVRYRSGRGTGPSDRRESLTAEDFSAIGQANKAGHKFGTSVDVYPPEEYEGYDLILLEEPRYEDGSGGGTATISISPQGEVGSVTKSAEANPRMVRDAFEIAIETGKVRWLNGFDTVLPTIYAALGFRPVARLAFDPDYQPDGWDYETYAKFNGGKPDVVFMSYVGKPSTYVAGDGEYASDYDAAVDLTLKSVPTTLLSPKRGGDVSPTGTDIDFSNFIEQIDVPLAEFDTPYRSTAIGLPEDAKIFPRGFSKEAFLKSRLGDRIMRLTAGEVDEPVRRIIEARDQMNRASASVAIAYKVEMDKITEEDFGGVVPYELIAQAQGHIDGNLISDEAFQKLQEEHAERLEEISEYASVLGKEEAQNLRIASDQQKDEDMRALIDQAIEAAEARRDVALKELAKLSPPKKREWSEGRAVGLSTHIIDMREKLIRPIQEKLVAAGVDPQIGIVISDTGGIYITRAFRMFTDSSYLQRVRSDKGQEYVNKRQMALDYFEKDYVSRKKHFYEVDKGYDSEEALEKAKQDLILADEKSGGSYAQEMLDSFLSQYDSATGPSAGKNYKVLTDNLKKRVDLPKPIRELLGEFGPEVGTDLIVRTLSTVSTLTAQQTFLDKMAVYGQKAGIMIDAKARLADLADKGQESEYATWIPLRKQGDERVAKDQIRGLSNDPLKHIFVPPALKDELDKTLGSTFHAGIATSAEEVVNSVLKSAHWLTGLGMALKTLPNPAFHLRNAVGNSGFFAWSQGVAPWTPAGRKLAKLTATYSARRIKNPNIVDPELVELANLGIIRDELRAGIIRDLLNMDETVESAIAKAEEAAVQASTLAQRAEGLKGAALEKAREGINKANEVAMNLSAGIDGAAKIALFYHELEVLQDSAKKYGPDSKYGRMSEAQLKRAAARKIKMTMQSLSQAPPLVKSLTQGNYTLMFAPFLRFRTEVPRIVINTFKLAKEEIADGKANNDTILLKRGRQRKAAMNMFLYGVSAAIPSLLGILSGIGFGSDEDEALRKAGPDYYKRHTFWRFKLFGKMRSINLTYINPFSLLVDPILRAVENIVRGDYDKALPSIVMGFAADQYLDEQIVAGTVINAARNYDPKTRKPIWIEGADEPLEVATKLANFIGRDAFLPRSAELLYKSLGAVAQGDVPEVAANMLDVVAPFKVHTHDLEADFKRYLYESSKRMIDVRSRRNRVLRNVSLSENDIRKIYDDDVEKRRRMNAEMLRTIRGFENLGLTRQQIYAVMTSKNSGVSKNRAELLLTGEGFMDRPDISRLLESLATREFDAGPDEGRRRAEILIDQFNSYNRFIPVIPVSADQ